MITVLTIAGYDPSGGAGVLADIKVISAFDCYGVGAVTSLTLQNTQGVFGAIHQTGGTVSSQLQLLSDDFEIAAVKIGMLPTSEIVEAVRDFLTNCGVSHIVVDPIMKSSSGVALVDESGWRGITELIFPLASVITPNREEAERITGIPIRAPEDVEKVAKRLASSGAKAVVITGGESDAKTASDLLLDSQGTVHYDHTRVQSTSTHGTGCAFSSALACLLAHNWSLREAIPIAKRFVADGISTGPSVGKGRGPLNLTQRSFKIG
jgi:hydroxymethylpyrimidine kinase/phosphomethylpyrimidine kinase